eukprot:scaffold21885_cov39-Tisochrysis_lutea.AAC.3
MGNPHAQSWTCPCSGGLQDCVPTLECKCLGVPPTMQCGAGGPVGVPLPRQKKRTHHGAPIPRTPEGESGGLERAPRSSRSLLS